MDTAKILLDAATVIETRGWYQGSYTPPGTDPATAPVCARGAINVAAGLPPDAGFATPEKRRPSNAAAQALKRHINKNTAPCTVAGWNDNPHRTAEQVVTAMRECAAELTGRQP